ncbi:MAG: YkgJ family cysteine cluster protein, partial [Thermoplasmata archaeon]|nr:YkgJ family cysteine cluster protein [Thermoplasmata archaeon]
MDLDLLRGFRFECRPDCGLCCFAEPAATAPERQRLIQLEPALRWVPEESGLERLGARADGGACQLLSASRCRAHAARPYPCRAFPVHVHIGERVQASLVLACPGLQWNSGTGGLGQGAPPRGLESELEAVLQEATSSPLDALRADAASRLQRWLRRHRLSEEAWHGLREGVLEPILRGEEPERSLDLAPPPIVDPLEERAIFWEQGTGVVLLATDADGAYDLSVPRESGGIAQRLGSLAPPAAA